MRISSSYLPAEIFSRGSLCGSCKYNPLVSLAIHQLDKGELYQKISHDDSKLLFEPMGKGKGVDFGFTVSK
jgi:hypothetical protein